MGQEDEDKAYRIYMSDALYSAGLGHKQRFIDIINDNTKTTAKPDYKSPEEFTNDFIKSHGLIVLNSEGSESDSKRSI